MTTGGGDPRWRTVGQIGPYRALRERELLAELRALREELAELRAALRARDES